MNEQLVIQHLLQRKLFETRSKNPAFSLRAFAKKLKIGAGPLSQILSGNRRVSSKMAERLCNGLLLDPTEKNRVLTHFTQARKKRLGTITPEDTLQLSADQFKVIADWYNFAVLSLIKTQGAKWDAEWIASRLGIHRSEAQQSMDRLVRLDMIRIGVTGLPQRTRLKFETSDGIENLSVRQHNFQTLELIRESLDRDSFDLRDFSSINFPTDPQLLPKAKKLVRKFQKDMTKLLLQTQNPTEVYRMAVALFPLTQVSKTNAPKPSPSKDEASC